MIQKLHFSPETQALWQSCFLNSPCKVPFYTYKWQELYRTTIGKQELMFILYVPGLKTITALCINRNGLTFSGGIEISDYMDLIGPETYKEEAWIEILAYLKTNYQLPLHLHNVPQDSTTLSYFRKCSSIDTKVTVKQNDTTPILSLPTTYERYIDTLPRKHRHELERKIRKFTRENPTARVIISKTPHKDIEVLIQLMRINEKKQRFLTPEYDEFFRTLADLFRGQLLLQFLYVDDIPVAGLMAFTTHTSFLLYNSGFHIHKAPGAGFYLKAKSVQYAIEHGYESYNFLQGNERYKYELGGVDFGVFDISYATK